MPKRCLVTSRGFLRLVLGLATCALLVSGTEDSSNQDDIRDTLPQSVRRELEQRYSLTELGVLPSRCLRRLPDYFNHWELIADELPALNRAGELQARVDSLPLLDYNQLNNGEEMRRAHLILGMISSSYLNSKKKRLSTCPDCYTEGSKRIDQWMFCERCNASGTIQCLPTQLAEPYLHVSEQNGLVPILTHVLTDEWNWCKKVEEKPISLDNLALTASLTGTGTEQYFHLVVTTMIHAARELPVMMLHCPQAIRDGNDEHLITTLTKAATVLKEWNMLFAEAFRDEIFSKDIFLQVMRPFFSGFDKVGGVTFETTSGDEVLRWSGPSAGQNSTVMMFDALLNVEHESVNKDWFGEMNNYITTVQRRMVEDFQESCSRNSLRTYAQKCDNEKVRNAFNGMVNAMTAFRQKHFGLVHRYIVSKDTKGTGGTPWAKQLLSGIRATKKSGCPFRHMMGGMLNARGAAKCPMAARHQAQAGAKCPVTHVSANKQVRFAGPGWPSASALEAAGSPPAAGASEEGPSSELEVNSSPSLRQRFVDGWAKVRDSVQGLKWFQSN